MFVFKIYVSRDTNDVMEKLEKLENMLKGEFGSDYRLEVIKILENPSMASIDNILVTPTLIKNHPEPVRRIVGNFIDKEKVFTGLELKAS